MAETPIANRTILAVLPAGEDRASLIHIFRRSAWKLQFTSTFQETLTAVRSSPGLVISEVRFSDGQCWSDLLFELQKMECPPPLIVADRRADEHLWAEVLNLGGYDLLTKPFDAREVLHAVSTACRRTEIEQEMATLRKSASSLLHCGVPGIKVLTAFVGLSGQGVQRESKRKGNLDVKAAS